MGNHSDDLSNLFMERVNRAQAVQQHLVYLAPRVSAEKLNAVCDYLGGFIDELVAAFSIPVLEQGEDTEGERALLARLYPLAALKKSGFEVGSMSATPLFTMDGVESDPIALVRDGSLSVAEAARELRARCSDPLIYLQVQAEFELPTLVSALPDEATPRARVLLSLANQIKPDGTVRSHLAQLFGQAALKSGQYDLCAAEIERIVRDGLPLDEGGPSYLATYRAIALAALGDLTQARASLNAAASKAESYAARDPSPLCFALTEQYRLGFATGDYSELPRVGAILFQLAPKCRNPAVQLVSLAFSAMMQRQLGAVEAGETNAQLAVEQAHARRMAETEIEARNLLIETRLWKGEVGSVYELLQENILPLKVGSHALLSAEWASLASRTVTRERQSLPDDLAPTWRSVVVNQTQKPAIASAHIAAAQARMRARAGDFEGSALLVPAMRCCREIREFITEERAGRFALSFVHVYRAFIDLPVHDYMPRDAYLEALRHVAGVLEEHEELKLDLALAQALIQIRGKGREQAAPADRIDGVLAEILLDPENPDLHLELGSAYLASADSSSAEEALWRVLEIEPANGQAHLALGDVAMLERRWADAVRFYEQSLSLDPRLFPRLIVEYALALRFAGPTGRATSNFTFDDSFRELDPHHLWGLADGFAAAGRVQDEAEAISAVLKCGDDILRQQAILRLHGMGRADLAQPKRFVAAERSQAGPEAARDRKEPERGEGRQAGEHGPRSCDECGRSVIDLDPGPGRNLVVDSHVARAVGATCTCGVFVCVYPCTLAGPIPEVRLCPRCRTSLIGVIRMG